MLIKYKKFIDIFINMFSRHITAERCIEFTKNKGGVAMTAKEQFEQAIKLSINKRLFETGYISENIYQQAKIKIVGEMRIMESA